MLCSFIYVALLHDDVFVSCSATTKADEPQHSDKNEELHESSSDSEQQLSIESSNDESESEQEEVSK